MTSVQGAAVGAVLAIAGLIALAGCGGASTPSIAPASTAAGQAPAPTPSAGPSTPAVTPSPTEAPVASPSIVEPSIPAGSADPGDNGGFAFKPGEVFAYYVSQGFTCEDPTDSIQAAGYTVQRCLKDPGNGDPIRLVALVVGPDGVTGDAFAGVLRPAGKVSPTKEESIEHLAGFLAAMLGQQNGTEAAQWLVEHIGEASAQTTVAGLLTGTYTTDDSSGVGIYVETANDTFMAAPTPAP